MKLVDVRAQVVDVAAFKPIDCFCRPDLSASGEADSQPKDGNAAIEHATRHCAAVAFDRDLDFVAIELAHLGVLTLSDRVRPAIRDFQRFSVNLHVVSLVSVGAVPDRGADASASGSPVKRFSVPSRSFAHILTSCAAK